MTKPLNRGPASLLHWLACAVMSYDGEAWSRRGVDRPLKSRDARDEWSGPYCNAKTKLLPCSMEKQVGQKYHSRGRIKPFSRLNIYSWILHIYSRTEGGWKWGEFKMVDYRLATAANCQVHEIARRLWASICWRNIQILVLPFLTPALIWRNWMGLFVYDSQLFSLSFIETRATK